MTTANPPTSLRPTALSASQESLFAYLGMVLVCLITLFVGPYLTEQGVPNLRLFGWDAVALVAAGFIGVWLAPRTGFADLFDANVNNWQRLGRPLLAGLGFALADVLMYKLVLHPEPVTDLTPFMQPFPYSILLYGSGALYVECLYRLLPIPILMYIVGRFLLHNPKNERLFWTLALLTSVVEPLEQLITDSPGLIIYSFGTGYAMNLLQAVFFRRYGLLAGLFVRLGHYVLWHVGFGLWVQLAQG